MRISFLGHSGFLLELPSATLLFDWSEGELPTLRPGRPLLVFASHHHEDHFRPAIFQLGARPFCWGRTFGCPPEIGSAGASHRRPLPGV